MWGEYVDTAEVRAWRRDIISNFRLQKPILVVQGKGPTGKKSSHKQRRVTRNWICDTGY
jgi:hypothetical protein